MLVSGRPHIRLRISKNQLFRTLDDVNPIPELQQLEEYVLENANKLGIGTMGFGGETTLLGCKLACITVCQLVSTYLWRIIAGHTVALV